MSDPLLDLGNASAWSDRWVRVVARRQDDVRDTAPHAHAQGQLVGSLDGVLSVTHVIGAVGRPAFARGVAAPTRDTLDALARTLRWMERLCG